MHEYSRKRNYSSPSTQHYTIDNTEDIYGTTLTPTERCFVDPWDLENYDYVRKKIEQPLPQSMYYTVSASSQHQNKLPKYSTNCELECCAPYVCSNNIYSDIWNITKNDFQLHDNIENILEDVYDYGALSSSSSYDENPSSIEDNSGQMLIKTDFTISPMHYTVHGYSTSNVMDCYECSSVMYGYGTGGGMSSLYETTERYSKSDTIYNKTNSLRRAVPSQTQRYGLNNNGLLQIDYSCSWDDLDRAMGENYMIL